MIQKKLGKQSPCKRAVWQTDTLRAPRPLISGVTEVKGGCVLRGDRSTTGGACRADVLRHARPRPPSALTQQGGGHT